MKVLLQGGGSIRLEVWKFGTDFQKDFLKDGMLKELLLRLLRGLRDILRNKKGLGRIFTARSSHDIAEAVRCFAGPCQVWSKEAVQFSQASMT